MIQSIVFKYSRILSVSVAENNRHLFKQTQNCYQRMHATLTCAASAAGGDLEETPEVRLTAITAQSADTRLAGALAGLKVTETTVWTQRVTLAQTCVTVCTVACIVCIILFRVVLDISRHIAWAKLSKNYSSAPPPADHQLSISRLTPPERSTKNLASYSWSQPPTTPSWSQLSVAACTGPFKMAWARGAGINTCQERRATCWCWRHASGCTLTVGFHIPHHHRPRILDRWSDWVDWRTQTTYMESSKPDQRYGLRLSRCDATSQLNRGKLRLQVPVRCCDV